MYKLLLKSVVIAVAAVLVSACATSSGAAPPPYNPNGSGMQNEWIDGSGPRGASGGGP